MDRWRVVRAVALWLCLSGATAAAHAGGPARAPAVETSEALARAYAHAGLDAATLAPDADALQRSPTHARRPPLLRDLMREPLLAHQHVSHWENELRNARDDPHALATIATRLAGLHPTPIGDGPDDGTLQTGSDPLEKALALMLQGLEGTSDWRPALPDDATLPAPLRLAVARMLAAIGRAERARRLAFVGLPADLTATTLLQQVVHGAPAPDDTVALTRLLSRVDRATLAGGLLDLVAAVRTLDVALAGMQPLPAVAWRLATPLGLIVVDTTGANNHHDLVDPLLVIDVGGDDRYTFKRVADQGRISVLLDRGGNDRYLAHGDAADPAAAVLGYGILWDTDGNDIHEGGWFAQGAALFGGALLWDGGGQDRYRAIGLAQGYALGGIALAVSRGGDDDYHALTHAQGSAGPDGVVLLLNVAGDDRYTLGALPLVRASPQLPERNVSMGQGAGRGIRPRGDDAHGAAGGIGMLVDLAGDDHYHAQVFAQGAGYHEGLGMLVDGGGSDVFESAWYGMGAAAHAAAGVLIKRGGDDDVYRASHVTSIGAAHDLSMAFFLDEGGNDRYTLGGLGIGAAHDHSVAVFADLGGSNHYTVHDPACRAYGASVLDAAAPPRGDLLNRGLFFDLGGAGSSVGCALPRGDAATGRPAPGSAR